MELLRNLWLKEPMMRGDDVLAVQQRLIGVGYKLDQDGLFGRGTRDAVNAFQQRSGLLADGIVGIATWERLMRPAAAPGGAPAPVAIAPRAATDILVREHLDALCQPHGRFKDGCLWSMGGNGVRVGNETQPVTSSKDIDLAREVLLRYAQPLATVLSKVQVPVELVVACICTESSGRADAKRLEPGGDRTNPERTPSKVSWGLMQTLLSTARSALGRPDLPLSDLLIPEISFVPARPTCGCRLAGPASTLRLSPRHTMLAAFGTTAPRPTAGGSFNTLLAPLPTMTGS